MPDLVNFVVGQVLPLVIVLNTEIKTIKTKNHLKIVNIFRTIIIGDLGILKKIARKNNFINLIHKVTQQNPLPISLTV